MKSGVSEFLSHSLHLGSENVTRYMQSMKGSLIGVLAKRMPKKEAKQLAIHWGYYADTDEKKVISIPASIPSSLDMQAVEENLRLKALNEKLQSELQRPRESSVLYHPYFGELISDLRYKKVYLTSVLNLSRSPVWDKQRILRPERAQEIAKAKKSTGSFVLPGIITFFHNQRQDRCGIIDGQHRAAALLLLAQAENWDVNVRDILVEVFDVTSDEEIKKLFQEINSGQPVRLVDMPDQLSTYERDIMEEAVSKLVEEYLQFFKLSPNCKYPHLHVDSFRDDLYQSGVITRHKLDSAARLHSFIIDANTKLAKRSEEQWLAHIGDSISHRKAVKKAMDHNFFLGLDSAWMQL